MSPTYCITGCVGTTGALDVVRYIDPTPAGKNPGSWTRNQSPGYPQIEACRILTYPAVKQNVYCGLRHCTAAFILKELHKNTGAHRS